jgi:hypothetical protein
MLYNWQLIGIGFILVFFVLDLGTAKLAKLRAARRRRQ